MIILLNKKGRKLFGFYISKKVAKEFSSICKEKGLWGNRQIEIMILDFINKKKK